ncbi:MAG: M48 family metallopeptidase [Bacteroidetes bacterium]|nr:M48 family metallopeptidase [Bacteroidota bacterium]
MKKIVLILIVAIFVNSCTKVPITYRKQNTLVPEAEIQSLSSTEYQKFLKEHKLSTDAKQNEMVKSIGNNIATNITTFFKTYKDGKYYKNLANYQWEFNVVEDTIVNAWCMPSGKVVVYTGLLPVTQNENALAVVMGHEIAHAIAKHGNERMSQQMKAQALGTVVSMAVSNSPQVTQDIFNVAFGVLGNLAILKYSRTHETEADKLGLVFMALAGYDPNEAIPFWERMSKMSGGAKLPQFLSTHPSDAQRIKELQAWMPEALKYYTKKAG